MEVEEKQMFSNEAEAAAHYKKLALEYKQKWKDVQQELEEFQDSSRELEAELEAQLIQLEAQNKELNTINNHLKLECDKLHDKLKLCRQEAGHQIKNLQDELSHTTQVKDELARYIRELEQSNDDLERAKRITVSSLEDFEGRLNNAIERNAFLESELDDKESLQVMVQRLKDEARDLKQELNIHRSSKVNRSQYLEMNKVSNNMEPSQSRFDNQELVDTSQKIELLEGHERPTVTPATRISALNIVGDLLRKVGALESKLSSCHNYIKDNSFQLKEDLESPWPKMEPVNQISPG